ncbi:hypothetical protein ABB07_11925 [Streptomyces incarnatus]|uniref:Putative amidase domain-containing protein n=1 Tax=Streptomyces incarnatus TaxID=665007 RepID=A0ABM5TIA5_9ACTN|nr:amidase domain-containing protein [Streptomyces incarnatus]AKJ10695.1 hypothetical protein ABB07_11925 [Streptomyces incarnatus]
MVSYEGINNALPKKWQTAAAEWASLSKYALGAAKDLRNLGVKPLADNWTDEVGQAAAGKFENLANQLEAASDILLSVKMAVEGVTTAIETAQSTLREATELADRYGLTISTDGTVTGPPVHNRMEAEDLGPYRTQVLDLINQAVEQVTTADKLAATEFAKLAEQTNLSDPDKALKLQNDASHVEMQMLAADVPVGQGPTTVREWWDGLTAQQRKDMMLAEPVLIANLDGIPPDVQQDLRGNGKYDRVKLVQYALDNWDKSDPTDFGNNCTNFVSNALHAAGMKEKTSIWGTSDDDSWMIGNPTGIDRIDRSLAYSNTWSAAENQKDFMLRHGGEEIPRSEVKPGDILYFEQSGPNDSIAKGNTHHAAIVTAVMPDGEIKYTQHTDSYQNVSLDGRLPATEKHEGAQNVRIVRPNPDWY